MIFFKKNTEHTQVLTKTQAKLAKAFFYNLPFLRLRKIFMPTLFSSFGMLSLFVACAFLVTFSMPGASLAQEVKHELKGTVLPPAKTNKGQPENALETNSTKQSKSNLGSYSAGPEGTLPEDVTLQVGVEAVEESVGTTETNATLKEGASATLKAGVNATAATGEIAGNATAFGGSNQASESGSLSSMGDDEYFKVAPKEEEAFSWSGYFVAVGGLLLVLAVLWMMVWLLRKRGAFPGASLMNRNAFKVEATLPLGPKRCLMLVRFLNSRYLLGVTDQQITLIKELEEQDAQGIKSSKTVANSGSSGSSASNRADAKSGGKQTDSTQPLDFAQALHEESQKNDGKLQL